MNVPCPSGVAGQNLPMDSRVVCQWWKNYAVVLIDPSLIHTTLKPWLVKKGNSNKAVPLN